MGEQMLRKLLFETRAGEWLLALLETKCRLAVVDAGWLAERISGPSKIFPAETE